MRRHWFLKLFQLCHPVEVDMYSMGGNVANLVLFWSETSINEQRTESL